MIRINLLPVKAVQKKEMLQGQLFILVLCVLVVGVGCGVVYASLLGKITAVKQENLNKQNEINRLKQVIGEVGRFKKLQQELQGKLDVLETLKVAQSGPVHLLDELSKAVPDKLWIVSFKEAAGNVALSGVGLNEETVASFLRDLEASPYYMDVELKVVEQTSQGDLKLQKFDADCRVETPTRMQENK